jgi:hypothetical protein
MTAGTKQLRARALLLTLSIVGLLSFIATTSLCAQDVVKLYLKDGSYQLVKSYEIHGDRVRFYSVERSDWEEVPLSIVDLDATKRAKKQEAVEAEKAIDEAKELEKEHFERPPDSGFEITPGIHLPQSDGIYTYDGLRLIRLIQSKGEIVTDKKRMALNLAVPAPVFKNRQFVVLPGKNAAVRITNPKSAFFAQFADNLGATIELIGVKPGKEDRVVESIESRFRPSHATEGRKQVPLERVQIAPEIVKLTPIEPLAPGEYAFAELIQDKLNLDVWDFGVEGRSKVSQAPPPSTTAPTPMSEEPPDDIQTKPKPKAPQGPVPLPAPTQPPPSRPPR